MATRQCSACGCARKYLRPETGYRCRECRKPEPQTCLHCGDKFTGRKRKYCTERCQDRASWRRKYKPRPRRYSRKSVMYYAWRNAQRPDKRYSTRGYQGSLEEYAHWRECVAMGGGRADAWWSAPRTPRPRMSREDQQRYWRRYQRRRRARDIDKTSARRFIQHGVERGDITKPDECERCHQPTPRHLLHGHHHEGYVGIAKGDVRWLCTPCHVIEEGVWGGALPKAAANG